MWTRRRRRLMLFLVAVSVGGILSMHGIDPVVASVDDAHSDHMTDIESGVEAQITVEG